MWLDGGSLSSGEVMDEDETDESRERDAFDDEHSRGACIYLAELADSWDGGGEF